MLADHHSNCTGRDLARKIGNVRVRYGAISSDGMSEGSKVAFGDPLTVRSPRRGETFAA